MISSSVPSHLLLVPSLRALYFLPTIHQASRFFAPNLSHAIKTLSEQFRIYRLLWQHVVFFTICKSLPSMPDYQAEKGIEAFIALFCWLYFSFGNFRSGFLVNYAVFVSLMSQTTRSDSWRNSMWMEMVERSLSMENNWWAVIAKHFCFELHTFLTICCFLLENSRLN